MKFKFMKWIMLSVVLLYFFEPAMEVCGEEREKWVVCEENMQFEGLEILESIDTISYRNSVEINGRKNLFYPVFDHKEEALRKVSIAADNVLKIMAVNYNLSPLCEDNWKNYYDALASCQADLQSDEIRLLEVFFDIYENDTANTKIFDCLNKGGSTEEVSRRLYYLLPLSTPLVSELSEIIAAKSTFRSSFDVSAASNYARAYAEHPNVLAYGDLGGSDCTNFASQIMERGGILQDDDIQWPWLGWWHVKEGNSHYYSNSWTAADNFARYMGITYSTQSHYDFSAHLRAGDFILVDIGWDGDWNHAGYVLEVDDYLTDGYYDYFVAQHSNNYLAWTSLGDNNWENQDGYGIIRK